MVSTWSLILETIYEKRRGQQWGLTGPKIPPLHLSIHTCIHGSTSFRENKTPKIPSIRIYNSKVTGIFLVQCAVCSSTTAFCSKIISQLCYDMKFEAFKDGQGLRTDPKLVAIIRNVILTGFVVNPRTKINLQCPIPL